MSLRIVFAGTPEFAVPCFSAAHAKKEVVAVYTQPDRPAGRGRAMQSSPVKQAALAAGIEIFQPEKLRNAEAIEQLRALKPDLMIVVAYGLILPQAVLDIPRFGCWNVHASLLPRWRGAAPIQRAIEAGDQRTGVCLMQMEKGLDTGPVLLQLEHEIRADETAASLHDALAQLGAQVISDGLGLLRAGLLPKPQVQAADGISYAHKIEKSEARIDWQADAETIARKVRAFYSWPIAEAQLGGERVRIHAAQALQQSHQQQAGDIIAMNKSGIDVACGEGVLRITLLQREGGKAIRAADYVNAMANK